MVSRRQFWVLVALTLMWGVNWPMMKLSLRELSPLYFRALTMTGGALWLFFFFRARGVRMWPRWAAGGGEWRSVLLLGLPNILGWHTLSILGVSELASGRAAVLGFTMPIWTVLLGAAFFGQALTRRVSVAALAAGIAVALLLADELTSMTGRPLGIAWMLVAAMCWALGTLMMRRAHLTLPVEALTVWMMGTSAALLWVAAAAMEPWPSWQFSPLMWGALAFGVFINYGVAQIIWFGLARHLPASTSAMSIMAIPVIGTLSATFITDEVPGWQDVLAVVFVMAAIAAVLLPAGALGRLRGRLGA
ncbi:MAG: DMT family transporter [Hydrogenophaga sp.]|uniref:DMT family transporter n=1 Tax=Hydrogenophaga sp. TaxID=1904254 RepID=UPI002735049B|nr:DMT family transporter [Hydrogenophaga sp.]MDP3626297.1 DMT family transporter [Hydrogenophaga sp.]